MGGVAVSGGSIPNVPTLGGAFTMFICAIFMVISGALALTARARLVALSLPGGAMPAASSAGCGCYPSIPAQNGLSWTSFAVLVITAPATNAVITLISLTATSRQMMGGGPLLGAAVVLNLIAGILTAVCGCQLRGLPGIGEGNCCCVANLAPKAADGSFIVINTGGTQPPPGINPYAAAMGVNPGQGKESMYSQQMPQVYSQQVYGQPPDYGQPHYAQQHHTQQQQLPYGAQHTYSAQQ